MDTLISQMDKRSPEGFTTKSRSDRYWNRKKSVFQLCAKRFSTKNSDRMKASVCDWDEVDSIVVPTEKCQKSNRKRKKSEETEEIAGNSKGFPPETSAKQLRMDEPVVEESLEERLAALRERLAKNPIIFQIMKPPPGYLQGRLPSDYFKKKAQEEKERKIREEKKALRLEKEQAERLEKEEQEEKTARRRRQGGSTGKKRRKTVEKTSKLTDPALAPSEISLFALDSIPSAPKPTVTTTKLPELSPVQDPIEVDTLDVSFEDLFDLDINVDQIMNFEQQQMDASLGAEPVILDDFEITTSDDTLPHIIVDEVDGVLYNIDRQLDVDDSFSSIGQDGIDDAFLQMMTDDDIKIDPVMAFNEGFSPDGWQSA